MSAHDLQKIVEAYSITCLSYEKAFNKQLLDLFISDLSCYSAQQISKALQDHRLDPDRGRFFPKVADLVYQIARASQKPELKTLIPIEWSKVIQASKHGRKPSTHDQFSLAALQMVGGCNVVGYAQPDELEKLRRQFAENYTAIASVSAESLPQHLDNLDQLKMLKTGIVKS